MFDSSTYSILYYYQHLHLLLDLIAETNLKKKSLNKNIDVECVMQLFTIGM